MGLGLDNMATWDRGPCYRQPTTCLQTVRPRSGRRSDSFTALSQYYSLRQLTSTAASRSFRPTASHSVLRRSIRSPTVSVFIRFWWNFAKQFGFHKVRSSLFGVKMQSFLPLFYPDFYGHNAFLWESIIPQRGGIWGPKSNVR